MTRLKPVVAWAGGLLLIAGVLASPSSADTGAPSVSITAPAQGTSLSGLYEVTATAQDDVAVTVVELLVDGVVAGTDDGQDRTGSSVGTYRYLWNSNTVADGGHTLVGRARDAAGNETDSTAVNIVVTNANAVPLTDLGTGTYKGFEGGLYAGGANAPPPEHLNEGIARANAITPLDADGAPDPNGKYVFLSVGFSSPSIEWCGGVGVSTCNPDTFESQASLDADVNHSNMLLVNGAQGGSTAVDWDSPTDPPYADVLNQRLVPHGVTEEQVQVVWAKMTNRDPTRPLPDPDADAYRFEATLGKIVRALKIRYPNVKLVFFSSRIYGGYSSITLAPEPYAYENGLSVKWLVDAQIRQMAAGQIVDLRAGDLSYTTVAPWIGWGPYFWANGTTPRSDGLTWQDADIKENGVHPEQSGIKKVGDLLMSFFKTNPAAAPWFLASAGPPDTVAPSATIIEPSDGATVSGVVPVNATAGDDVGVTNVELLVDGVVRASDATAPYGFSWNSTSVGNGNHTLVARASDAAGNTGLSPPVDVDVANIPDTTPPTAAIAAPSDGATVSGVVPVEASAGDDVGVTNVELLVDGVVRASDADAPYAFSWNSTSVANGSHALVARAYDGAGNTGLSPAVNVMVANTPSGTLSVSLRASPSRGPAPILDVDLTATVRGTATGPVTYTFYCNRSDAGTDVQPGWAARFENVGTTKQSAVDACDYGSPGTYTAKVIVQRGGLAAEARFQIVVN